MAGQPNIQQIAHSYNTYAANKKRPDLEKELSKIPALQKRFIVLHLCGIIWRFPRNADIVWM